MKKLFTALLLISVFAIGFFGFIFLASPNEKENITKPQTTLKTGTWILEKDSLSSLEITKEQLVFKYHNNSSKDLVFNYLITDQTTKDDGIIIKAYNKTDTLQYQIMVQNDTLLNLLDLNFGTLNLYYIKKE